MMSLNIKKSNHMYAISLSISEVIFTITIASLVKLIAGELSVFLVLFFRYLFCIPLLVLTAIYQRGKDALSIKSKTGLALRTIAGLASFGSLFAALQYIDLSLMTILFQTMPLFVVILAPLLIKETVSWFRKILAVIGFIGIIFILNPGTDSWLNLGSILGIMCPFFGALMLISVRKLGQTDHPASTALWYNIFGAIVFLIISILNNDQWPQFDGVLLILCIIGMASSFQQICLAQSHKLAPASLLAPLRYISVPIGILIGVYFFKDSLSINFFVGTAIIILSTFIIIRSEVKK